MTLLATSLVSSNMEKPLSFFSKNITGPNNDINEEDIIIKENEVILKIKDASISRYSPTGSMLPVLNEKSNGIRIAVESENDINIGDIISYQTKEGLIVHRVVEIGNDGKWYCIAKGDNNSISDGKIRFNQIKYKTIGVLW